jgi:hypothetical protein
MKSDSYRVMSSSEVGVNEIRPLCGQFKILQNSINKLREV